MELIGRINRRKIYYIQVRNNPDWKNSLPKNDWVAFTIANIKDEELVPPAVKICMDKNVSYVCCAGTLANWTENYFDEEISWRIVDFEMQHKKEFDYKISPVTTTHENFEVGFWFATTLTHKNNFNINRVICIDFTNRKVRKQLIELINKINNGWLPDDEIL